MIEHRDVGVIYPRWIRGSLIDCNPDALQRSFQSIKIDLEAGKVFHHSQRNLATAIRDDFPPSKYRCTACHGTGHSIGLEAIVHHHISHGQRQRRIDPVMQSGCGKLKGERTPREFNCCRTPLHAAKKCTRRAVVDIHARVLVLVKKQRSGN